MAKEKIIGIYYIKCLINKKVYIGSSTNIHIRFSKHLSLLKHNKHSNQYLQNSFNKYKIKNFIFGIITICNKEELLIKEQFYIDRNKNLFNVIIKNITRPTLTEEVRRTISKKINELYKNEKLSRYNTGSFKKGSVPWNKGKKYKSTNHLKVPKRKKGDRTKYIKSMRNKLPYVDVYDKNMKFIKRYNNSKDLEHDSIKNDFELISHMNLRNKKGRQGHSPYLLQSVNINKSNKLNTKYKTLYFKLIPKVHVKQDELLENPEDG